MEVITKQITLTYKPADTPDSITLTTKPGDGQSSGYVVTLGGDVKAANKQADLGKRNDVLNKNIIVSATMSPTTGANNKTSVSLEIVQGGISTPFGPFTEMLDNADDFACFVITIKCTA